MNKTMISFAANTALIIILSGAIGIAHADDNWSFKNVSVNMFSWGSKTKANTEKGFAKKSDFTYLEAEGGAGAKWGDIYGFFDIENPLSDRVETDTTKNRRYTWKAVANVNMFELAALPVQLHMQIYDFTDNNFNNANRVIGLGTSINKDNFQFKPFIGYNQEYMTGVGAHDNGVIVGWVLGYSFKLGGEAMKISNWHEMEFDRKDQYLGMADAAGNFTTGGKTGVNGAVSLWWDVNKSATLGGTYRYALNKLGSATYEDGLILTARYNF